MAERSAFWNGLVTGDAVDAPYDANTEFAKWVQRTIGLGNTRANAGVVLGTGSEATQLDALQVTQNSPAGMSVLLNIGAAIVDGTTYINDAAITIPVAANASGNPRIDTVVLRKSFGIQEVRSAILAGTPAATPAPPALTQSAGVTWEIPIADIQVANGAVSITTANITPRTPYANAADGVTLDRLLNNTASALVNGDMVNIDSTANRAVNNTPSLAARPPTITIGPWQARIAAAGIGRVLYKGIGNLNGVAAAARGTFVSPRGSPSVFPQFDTIALLLEAATGSGGVQAFIDAGFPQQFGQIGDTVLLAAPAATLTVGGGGNSLNGGYRTVMVEYFLRSAIVATNDNARFIFGADTTAANYRSYRLGASGTVPTMAAAENIGALAGVQLNIPGSTATAGAFAYGFFFISNVNLTTFQRHWIGINFYRVSDVTGGFAVNLFGGLWNNAGAGLTSIVASHAAGANFETGSYLNVYTKQV